MMTSEDIRITAFRDELEKISGEFHGATRTGRKPIGVERYLERESEVEGVPDFMLEAGEQAAKAVVKLAGAGRVGVSASHKTLALLAAGAGGGLVARQANEDRKVGRMLRRQQAQQQ